MKRALSKTTFAPPDYSYENPFSSSLKLMQNVCAKTLRPTWSCQDLEMSPDEISQLCCPFEESDFDAIQFKNKYQEEDMLRDDFTSRFSLVLPPQMDLPSKLLEFPSENCTDFKPETLQIRGLQIQKTELWSELICDEKMPTTIKFYDEVRKIVSHPLQYDDPLKMSPSPLLPAISADNFAPQISLAPANLKMSLKDFTYPETPAFDYLVDVLASKVENLSIDHSAQFEKNALIMPGGEKEKKQYSEIQREASPPIRPLVTFTQPRPIVITIAEDVLTSGLQTGGQSTGNIELITVELSSFAISCLRLMEDHIVRFLNNLKCSNFPPIKELFKFPTISELEPNTTRLCLLKLKENISAGNSDPKQAQHDLDNILPALLSLHGVNKALDIFLNIEYDLAYEALADFQKTHETILRTGDYKNLFFRLLRLRPENRDELHPKLSEVKAVVLRQLQTDTTGRKIWIRLYRHSNDVAARISHFLTEAGVLCEVDPQIVHPESAQRPFLPSGNYPVIIAERTPKDFPPTMLSLIIHYERPPKSTIDMDQQFAGVTQKAIVIHRPVRLEDNLSAQEDIQISVPAISASIFDEANFIAKPSTSSMFTDKDAETAELCEKSTGETEHLIQTEIQHRRTDNTESLADTESQLFDEEDTEEGLNTKLPSVVEMDQKPPDGFVEYLPIVLSAALKDNGELMKSFQDNAGNLTIHECDYSFLDACAKYQPDILISLNTALLIVHEEQSFEEIRFKILTTSLKCTKCWVLLLAPSVIESSKPPKLWHSLIGLTRFYEKKDRGPAETRFVLKPRLALTYTQVSFMVKDIVEDEANPDIESHLQPLCIGAKLLLHFPQFNAVSAPLIAEQSNLKELLTLPIETLCSQFPLMRRRIKIFRYCQDLRKERLANQVRREENSSFGVLKPVLNLQEESEPYQSPNKRVKLDDGGDPEDYGTLLIGVSQLRDMWSSPYIHPAK